MTADVGFIGLGRMGLPMATNLVQAGYRVHAWNRSQESVDRIVELGATRHPTPSAVAAAARVVIVMVPDLPDVRSLLEGPEGLLAAQRMRTLVIMGTVSPVGVRQLSDELVPLGVAVVDAPVSGGVKGATAGTLAIMVGGDAKAVEGVRPCLEVMGATVAHLGPSGAGSLAKACNQMVVAGTLVSLAEAAVLARSHGLDVGQVLDVLSRGLAQSEVLSQKRDALATQDYTASGPAKFLVKDLRFALEAGGDADLTLPVTEIVQGLYTGLTEAGLGDQDNSVVAEYVRQLRQPKP